MRTARIVLAGVVAAGLIFLLWPSEERRIRATLQRLADAASVPPSESDLDHVARLAVLARGITRDAVFDPGGGRTPVTGRDAIAAMASRAAPRGPWQVRLEDVVVALAGDGHTARVEATVVAEGEGVRPTALAGAQEILLDLRQIDGQWLVAGAAIVDALDRPR